MLGSCGRSLCSLSAEFKLLSEGDLAASKERWQLEKVAYVISMRRGDHRKNDGCNDDDDVDDDADDGLPYYPLSDSQM